MDSTSKRLKGCDNNNGIDRLTQLPDHILVHILSFLPIVDAVRTVSIRRFGSLWTLLPSLEFHEYSFFKRWPSEEEDYTPRFADFVRNVLFLHKRASIDKFRLCFEYITMHDDDYRSFYKEVTAWIRFAIDRQVRDLDIGGSSHFQQVDDLILPQCVFTSQFLVMLKIAKIPIIQRNQVHMGSLRKLSLWSVEVSNEVLQKIILGCPCLQHLVLKDVCGSNELSLTAPTVIKLVLSHCTGLINCPGLKVLDIGDTYETPVQVVGVSSIHEVSIRNCYNLNNFKEYVKRFSKVKVFKYCDGAIQSSELKELDFPQTRWRSLHIRSMLRGFEFLGICNILRSSPNLEELIVYNNSPYVSVATATDTNILFRELPTCLMKKLKTVTMHGFEVSSHGLLQLANVLLKSSVSLEKMVILPSKKSAAGNEVKFLTQLLSFPRASTNAKVIYGSELY